MEFPVAELLRSIGYPHSDAQSPSSSHQLYRIARMNKIGSLYMRSLHENDCIGDLEQEWENRKNFQHRLSRTYSHLNDDIPATFEYAIVKSYYDFWADSKDIDILIFDGNIEELQRGLLDLGYGFFGESPTSFDVVHPSTGIQIDIQSDFSLQHVVYLRKESIRNNVKLIDNNGVEMPIASAAADLAIIIIHSITEQLFILKEFFAAIHILEDLEESEFNEFLRIVEENNIGPACRAFFTLIGMICEKVFEREPSYLSEIMKRYPPYDYEAQLFRDRDLSAPYHYSNRTAVRTFFAKTRNSAFRRSLIRQLPHVLKPSTMRHIVNELAVRRDRNHYVGDTSDMFLSEDA